MNMKKKLKASTKEEEPNIKINMRKFELGETWEFSTSASDDASDVGRFAWKPVARRDFKEDYREAEAQRYQLDLDVAGNGWLVRNQFEEVAKEVGGSDFGDAKYITLPVRFELNIDWAEGYTATHFGRHFFDDDAEEMGGRRILRDLDVAKERSRKLPDTDDAIEKMRGLGFDVAKEAGEFIIPRVRKLLSFESEYDGTKEVARLDFSGAERGNMQFQDSGDAKAMVVKRGLILERAKGMQIERKPLEDLEDGTVKEVYVLGPDSEGAEKAGGLDFDDFRIKDTPGLIHDSAGNEGVHTFRLIPDAVYRIESGYPGPDSEGAEKAGGYGWYLNEPGNFSTSMQLSVRAGNLDSFLVNNEGDRTLGDRFAIKLANPTKSFSDDDDAEEMDGRWQQVLEDAEQMRGLGFDVPLRAFPIRIGDSARKKNGNMLDSDDARKENRKMVSFEADEAKDVQNWAFKDAREAGAFTRFSDDAEVARLMTYTYVVKDLSAHGLTHDFEDADIVKARTIILDPEVAKEKGKHIQTFDEDAKEAGGRRFLSDLDVAKERSRQVVSFEADDEERVVRRRKGLEEDSEKVFELVRTPDEDALQVRGLSFGDGKKYAGYPMLDSDVARKGIREMVSFEADDEEMGRRMAWPLGDDAVKTGPVTVRDVAELVDGLVFRLIPSADREGGSHHGVFLYDVVGEKSKRVMKFDDSEDKDALKWDLDGGLKIAAALRVEHVDNDEMWRLFFTDGDGARKRSEKMLDSDGANKDAGARRREVFEDEGAEDKDALKWDSDGGLKIARPRGFLRDLDVAEERSRKLLDTDDATEKTRGLLAELEKISIKRRLLIDEDNEDADQINWHYDGDRTEGTREWLLSDTEKAGALTIPLAGKLLRFELEYEDADNIVWDRKIPNVVKEKNKVLDLDVPDLARANWWVDEGARNAAALRVEHVDNNEMWRAYWTGDSDGGLKIAHAPFLRDPEGAKEADGRWRQVVEDDDANQGLPLLIHAKAGSVYQLWRVVDGAKAMQSEREHLEDLDDAIEKMRGHGPEVPGIATSRWLYERAKAMKSERESLEVLDDAEDKDALLLDINGDGIYDYVFMDL